MKSRLSLTILLLIVCFALSVSAASAQSQPYSTCPALVTYAVSQLATNCASADGNSVCYGYQGVNATFTDSVDPDDFTDAGDQVPLTNVQAVQTGPFDLDAQEWGLSFMNVRANLPNSMPGVVYLLLGGVEVENDVEPEDALVLDLDEEGIEVTTQTEADLHTYPEGLNFIDSEVLETIPAGATLLADAISADGEWVRVVYEEFAGWIQVSTLADDEGLDDLPVIRATDRTPMQDFYFRVGIGGQACTLAPSLLFVQGPPDVPVDIRLHDTNVRVQGTVVLRTRPPGDTLGDAVELITLFGLTTIHPGTDDAILVPPGHVSTVFLGEFVSLGIEGDEDEKSLSGSWSAPRALTQNELDLLDFLTDLPDNILYHPIEIPTIVTPSGVGQVLSRLIFRNPLALAAAQRACERDLLPDAICEYLGID